MLNNTKFNKIFDDLHDDHVRSIVVYVDPETNIIHADSDCTEPLDADTVTELFTKRMAVGAFKGDNSRYAIPVGFTKPITNEHVSVMLVLADKGTEDASLVLRWAYSKEYTAE